jgi:hypothetical protein
VLYQLSYCGSGSDSTTANRPPTREFLARSRRDGKVDRGLRRVVGLFRARAAASPQSLQTSQVERISAVHSFANRRYPGFRSVVPCGPGSSGAFEGKRTIVPFGRGLREASGEGAAAGGGGSIALTGSDVGSIAASGASIGGAGSIRAGAGGGGAGSGALSRSSGVRHAKASNTPEGETGDQ